jgi:hypothetical protein
MARLKLVMLDANVIIKLSADLAVYRVLGLLGRGEQGISLEELLQRIGNTQQLEPRFSKVVRVRFTKEGQQDKVRGRGLKS